MSPSTPPSAPHVPVLDLVVPVHNEEATLERSIRRLRTYLCTRLPCSFRITVADNASTDGTAAIARRLARELPEVQLLLLPEKGRGGALRAAWLASASPILGYTDVDLSTDLDALAPLIAPIFSGHSDLAIGSRLAPNARVVRGVKREVVSRCYNTLLRGVLAARFSDAQCGFKAIRADVARALLPLVQDTGWFFDTELLVLAERAGLRIHEVPVDWVDDPDSRVDIVATAVADLRGIARLGRGLATGRIPVRELRTGLGRRAAGHDADDGRAPGDLLGQLVRFACVGAGSTLAYVVLYLLLRQWTQAQVANLVALLVTAVGNTSVNRRLTFGLTDRHRAGRHHLAGLVAFAAGLALTGGALALLHAGSAHPARALELAVVVGASLVATVIRFLLLRSWVFRPTRT